MFYFRTGFKHIPCILGKEIDLYLLYWLVTSQGGWEKVRLAFCLGITPRFTSSFWNKFVKKTWMGKTTLSLLNFCLTKSSGLRQDCTKVQERKTNSLLQFRCTHKWNSQTCSGKTHNLWNTFWTWNSPPTVGQCSYCHLSAEIGGIPEEVVSLTEKESGTFPTRGHWNEREGKKVLFFAKNMGREFSNVR